MKMDRCITGLITAALAFTAGCTDVSLPFNNIETDVKTRPLSVILEPNDAAPGDTVSVTTRIYAKYPATVSFAWSGILDYDETNYGEAIDGSRPVSLNIIGPESLAYDTSGLVTHSFRFIVPGNALSESNLHPDMIDISDIPSSYRPLLGLPVAEDGISRQQYDSLLAVHAFDVQALDPEASMLMEGALGEFYTSLRLTASVGCEINLSIFRTLTVRYNRRYNSVNTNTNPVINDISIICADESVSDKDDLRNTAYDSVIIYSRTNPVSLPGTVTVDTDKKYFLSYTHDQEQTFLYVRPTDPPELGESREVYDHRWCYSNLDDSSMEQDSLVLLTGEYSFLPPVDVDMHDFRIYLLLDDDRPELGTTSGQGTAFATGFGYFRYTDAYKTEHR